MPPLYSFPRPAARTVESLFIFISFGLVCRLAARHRDYRVPATHLGNSGGPLSAARSSPTTSFPLKHAGDPRGMTTDGVRPGASGTNLPSPPAAPRPASPPPPLPSLPHRPPSLLYPLPLSLLRPVPILSHHRACSPLLFLFYLSSFVSFYPFCLSSAVARSSLFLSFRCRFCSLFSAYVFLLHSLPVLLSLSPSLFLALLLSRTNYLCLISDTVDAKR